MGSSTGVGVTHFAIMLAGFFSAGKNNRIAMVELNSNSSFSALKKLHCHEDMLLDETREQFSLFNVDYFPHRTSLNVAGIFQMDYDYIVMDLGCNRDENINELLRCNIGCLVGSLSEWKISMFEKNICELQQLAVKDSFYFLTTFGMQKLKKKVEKKYHIKISSIPYEPTPFVLHRETFAFFEMLYM